MNLLVVAMAVLLILVFWSSVYGRKIRKRVNRIRKLMAGEGPDARICYMTMKGKRHTWQITIESARPRGQDWVVTAWCHEKEEFFVFYASRMYEYLDLRHYREVQNVPAYFTEKFGRKKPRKKTIKNYQPQQQEQKSV
jgi:predicted DNA-binding transcriptional regulator YafY